MPADPATLTLYPYLRDDCWVFDDARTGLKEEAFVLGVTDMITRMVASKGIPDATRGFALTFAAEPFAGHDAELRWTRADPLEGNWYAGEIAGLWMEGWLCPALLLYFRDPPPRIFVRCDPLPAGVDPIWMPPPGVVGRRFVAASAVAIAAALRDAYDRIMAAKAASDSAKRPSAAEHGGAHHSRDVDG